MAGNHQRSAADRNAVEHVSFYAPLLLTEINFPTQLHRDKTGETLYTSHGKAAHGLWN